MSVLPEIWKQPHVSENIGNIKHITVEQVTQSLLENNATLIHTGEKTLLFEKDENETTIRYTIVFKNGPNSLCSKSLCYDKEKNKLVAHGSRYETAFKSEYRNYINDVRELLNIIRERCSNCDIASFAADQCMDPVDSIILHVISV